LNSSKKGISYLSSKTVKPKFKRWWNKVTKHLENLSIKKWN